MKNIFENAKFGYKFRTRDGRMAVFVGITRPEDTYRFKVLVEGYGTDDLYCWCGRTNMHAEDRPYDIIGKWQEPIDKEELVESTTRECGMIVGETGEITMHHVLQAYKAGYMKRVAEE